VPQIAFPRTELSLPLFYLRRVFLEYLSALLAHTHDFINSWRSGSVFHHTLLAAIVLTPILIRALQHSNCLAADRTGEFHTGRSLRSIQPFVKALHRTKPSALCLRWRAGKRLAAHFTGEDRSIFEGWMGLSCLTSVVTLLTAILPIFTAFSWEKAFTASGTLNYFDRLLSSQSSTLAVTVFGRTSLCCKRLAAVGTFLFKWHDKILLAQDSCWQVLTLGAGPLPVPDFSTPLIRRCLSPIGIIPQFQSVATGG